MSIQAIFWLTLCLLIYFLPIAVLFVLQKSVEKFEISEGIDELKKVESKSQNNLNNNQKDLESQASKNFSYDFNSLWNILKSILQTPKVKSSWILLVADLVIFLAYWLFHKNLVNFSWNNFALHFSGGVAVGLIFEYFLINLSPKNSKGNFENLTGKVESESKYKNGNLTEKLGLVLQSTFWLQFLVLYFLVSGLGAGNELLEFWLDSFSKKPFSSDRFDTWWDLTANTCGAIVLWLSLFGIKKIWRKISRNK